MKNWNTEIENLEKTVESFPSKEPDFSNYDDADDIPARAQARVARLNQLLKTIGMNQSQLAKLLDITPSIVSRWANAMSPLSLIHCRAIANLTGVDPIWLLQGKKGKTSTEVAFLPESIDARLDDAEKDLLKKILTMSQDQKRSLSEYAEFLLKKGG